MYVRREISLKDAFLESWLSAVAVAAWSVGIVTLHELAGLQWLVMPVLPVTLIGIAVSLYVGFKSVSAYNRWWEARTALGGMVAVSRELVAQTKGLIYNDAKAPTNDILKQIYTRHLAWIYAVAHILRRHSRLKASERTRIFRHRRVGHPASTLNDDPQSYGRFLTPEEYKAAQAFRNSPGYIMAKQADFLRELALAGYLDSVRQVALVEVLSKLNVYQGTCDRIKNTPFPRQIAHFGAIFTWIFVVLLPFALLGVFETEAKHHNFSTIVTHEFMYSLVPFAVMISWVFLMMERISDSTEDPFEGGVHDVPVSAICRSIEIDMKQAMGDQEDVPPPLETVDGVLY
jgi:putative membrane protein